jgi:hypothetical protein
VSAEGVWALKLATKVIPSASAQSSDSDTNAFMLFLYHRRRRLVQRNATVTVALESKAVCVKLLQCAREKILVLIAIVAGLVIVDVSFI